ncbi:hypothetical protein [Luteimonas vadosa]|uniref:Uncharacterized protein n=1 Tax=Luteimonas vadosa TaxID=1165507 RepID=A0ABP9DSQ7_9GAMM
MNASLQYPFDLHWTSQELADAAPVRLSEILDFHARRDGGPVPSANACSFRAAGRRPRFLGHPGRAEPMLFRIG